MARYATQLFDWEHEPVLERRRSASSAGTRLIASTKPIPEAAPAWELKRDPPKLRDHVLSALATAWLANLADGLKPKLLCERFPRVANRLALSWQDPSLANLVLDELLTDRRGGRRGFPPAVAAELSRLRAELRRSPMPRPA